MHGLLDVSLENADGKTRIRSMRQRPPLKLLRAFYPEGTSPAHLYLLNVSGGILGGDRTALRLRLGEGAAAVVSMPSATKVHPAPAEASVQTIDVAVGRNGCLEYLAAPLLPFSGAALRQETTVFLEEGAVLYWRDILGPGRAARGEIFAYRRLENRMAVRDANGMIVQESFRLTPEAAPVNAPGVMGNYSHLGTLYLFCPDGLLDRLLARIRSIEAEGLFWGATRLSRRGLAVRVLGMETPLIQGFFREVWRIFRREVFGRTIPVTRGG